MLLLKMWLPKGSAALWAMWSEAGLAAQAALHEGFNRTGNNAKAHNGVWKSSETVGVLEVTKEKTETRSGAKVIAG